MIIENAGIKGLKSDLAHLDSVASKLGFVRWQWEYYRATYDLKIEDKSTGADYFLRINTRVTEGKLEKPDTVLVIEDVYIGKATHPHGLDYSETVPAHVMQTVEQKLNQLQQMLSH